MLEFIVIYFPLIAILVGAAILVSVYRAGYRNERERITRETEKFSRGHEEWKINKELWELLKDDDPAWLMTMRIKDPTQPIL